MNDAFRHHLAIRSLGLVAILFGFAVQSAYEFFLCGGGLTGFWAVTAIAMAVPAAMLAWPRSSPCVVATFVILAFCLWANSMECNPYQGGGAAMSYVVVLLYGIPVAVAAGIAVGIATIPRRAARGQNAP